MGRSSKSPFSYIKRDLRGFLPLNGIPLPSISQKEGIKPGAPLLKNEVVEGFSENFGKQA
jgi:hypothetical protein